MPTGIKHRIRHRNNHLLAALFATAILVVSACGRDRPTTIVVSPIKVAPIHVTIDLPAQALSDADAAAAASRDATTAATVVAVQVRDQLVGMAELAKQIGAWRINHGAWPRATDLAGDPAAPPTARAWVVDEITPQADGGCAVRAHRPGGDISATCTVSVE